MVCAAQPIRVETAGRTSVPAIHQLDAMLIQEGVPSR
jgi:hypothetical protein